MQLDGLNTGAPLSGGGTSGYVPDLGSAQEVSFTTSGGLGEAEVGGPVMNIVPRTGGNTVKGNVYFAGVTGGMVGSNYTQELKDRGLRTPGDLLKLWDFSGSVGGPIKKDRVWYFFNVARRRQLSRGARHVRERQRRRPGQVHLRRGSDAAGRHRGQLAHRQPAHDDSGVAARTSSICSGTSSIRVRAPRGAKPRRAAATSSPGRSSAARRDRPARSARRPPLRLPRSRSYAGRGPTSHVFQRVQQATW